MSPQDKIEVLHLYITDLEQSLKQCKLERADFQAQGTALSRALTSARAQQAKPDQAADTPTVAKGAPTDVPPSK